MLHIRRTKVWFLPCKSMVFGVQKGGFCIAKVWFLFFECYVVANWSHAFRGWMWIFCGVFAILFQFASRVISRPLAAVGTDLSCPHIRIYPQNGEQKCVCGDLNIRILRCGHPFAMKWIYVFNNGKIRIWQCKDTGTMNRSPTPGGVFRSYFVGVCGYFTVCLLGYHNPLVTLWQTVSSRRGPIYRARISVYIHKMGNRNACVVIWIYVF